MQNNGIYRFDEFELNLKRRLLLRENQPVPLSPKAFEVLHCLVQHAGEVVTKEQLLATVWPNSFVEEGNLVQHVSALRKALSGTGYIATLPGRGYQFTAIVSQPQEVIPQSVTALQPEPDLPSHDLPGVNLQPGDVVVQRMRERTSIVVQEPSQLQPTERPKLLAVAARRLSSRWMAWGVTAAVLLALAGYVAWQRYGPQPQLRKVELADFLNLTDDASMDHPLKSALAISLGQTPYIQLMGDGLQQSTLQQMQKPADTPLLGDTALEVCARGFYQALLQPRIESPQNLGYDLSLDVVDCSNGKTLASFKGHALTRDAIMDTLDNLARRARIKLAEPNASLDRFNVSLATATTFSFEAMKDYSIGSHLGNQGKLKECILYFQKAVDIDPKFAVAIASIGTAYYNLGDMDAAVPYYNRAFSLSNNVSETEKFYIRSNYYLIAVRDLQAAAQNFQEWSKVYPSDETTWAGLANAQTQVGNFPAAIQAGEESLKSGFYKPSLGYFILTDAYKRTNRFRDVKRIIAEAQAQGKDSPELHQQLYEVAMIERDTDTLRREAAWNRDKPGLYIALESQAVYAADEGKVAESEELFKQAIADAAKEVDADMADSILMDEAAVEVQMSRNAAATELLNGVKHRDTANFAILQTRAGNVAAGMAYLQKPEKYPKDTVEHYLRIPELKALVALQHHDANGAIAALESARTFEVIRCEVIELRAQAYTAAGQPDKAAAEYQKIIANPGLEDMMQPRTVLAHLGLARALAQQQQTAESRRQYELFLAWWKDSSGNTPTLEQANREYARLQSATSN